MGDGPLNIGNFSLAPYLLVGAVASTPFAALVTKKVSNNWLKAIVGVGTVVLGVFSLTRTILEFTGVW